ncbi:MAG: heat-inducible transcriptional repressor HrcA, partial [Agathobaculum butyriciproducens]|nr:heat-inducible transcriptional repressor HrcA [Agathobaculum butyriciproducens]
MELSERKKQILKAIIGDYIRTAEPVGSKALTEGHELPFSSATIRNEMSELEDMGYLEKPHTSAGRIPSPQGYRLYVDELMERPADNAEDGNALQNSVLTKVRELDHLIQEAGKLLTSLTNYASVAITPAMTQIAIRQFEIIAVDKMNFVIVVVTDSGTVKNKMVRTVAEVSK